MRHRFSRLGSESEMSMILAILLLLRLRVFSLNMSVEVPLEESYISKSLEVVITDVDVFEEVLPYSSANTSVAPRFSMADIFLAINRD
jgi:hypothetical protein